MNLRIAILTVTFVIVSSPRPRSRIPEAYMNLDYFNKFFLGSYTKYEYVGNQDPRSPIPPRCHFVKIWMLMSPGSEYPSNWYEMYEIKEEILRRNQMNTPIWDAFQSWPDADLHYGSVGLCSAGFHEMNGIGWRSSERFPELLSATYEEIISASDGSLQSEQSISEFLLNAIDPSIAQDLLQSNSNNSLVFRLVHDCISMKSALVQAEEAVEQKLHELYSSPLAQNALLDIEHRLDIPMTIHKAVLIFQAYGYETAILKSPEMLKELMLDEEVKVSVWIRALNLDIVQIIQEGAEFELYYRSGTYDRRNYEPVCLIFKEIVNFFDDPTKKYAFYVAPAEMIVKMLTYLGLYDENESARYHAPFASNIAFVLYQCSGRFHILLLHQEHLKDMPACKYNQCTLHNFWKEYAHPSRCNPIQLCM